MQDQMVRLDPWGRSVRTSDHGATFVPLILQHLRRDRGFILVAEVGRTPVGIVVAWVRPFLDAERTEEAPTMTGYVSDLSVLPNWRGRGIGTRLLRAAERRFRRMGCDQLRLGVFAPNRAAVRLYRREGFEVRGMMLGKQLSGPRSRWPTQIRTRRDRRRSVGPVGSRSGPRSSRRRSRS